MEHRNFEELYQADKANNEVKLQTFESNQHAFEISGIEKDKRITLSQRQLDDATKVLTKEMKQRDTAVERDFSARCVARLRKGDQLRLSGASITVLSNGTQLDKLRLAPRPILFPFATH